jgi:hypothetical protein
MTWMRPVSLWPKNHSRSSGVVVDTGQMHPRGQSLGNQNVGALPGVDRPDERGRLRIARWRARLEPAE